MLHPTEREMKEDGELPRRVKVRSGQYLNNLIEQDHRRVKQQIRPMLGFKRFDNAMVTISGIELAEKIKKGQFKTGKLGGKRRPCQNYGTQHSLPDAYREQ
jgi:transposase-like protein